VKFEPCDRMTVDYDSITFNDPDAFLNRPAPDAWVSFMIGGLFSITGLVWWFHRVRTQLSKKEIITANLFTRVMISAAIDNDRNLFTMVVYSGASFIFLGGIQIDYDTTLGFMVAIYTITCSMEVIRVLLAYHSVKSIDEQLVLSSNMMQRKYDKHLSKKLEPKNVYQDVGRKFHIVFMIFATQFILIFFVCIDIQKSDVHKAIDGTEGCPIGGTLGSWLFYVLGCFMSLVFLLGPKTNFGEAEQDPAYWLHLFLEIRNGNTMITWQNDVKKKKERVILKSHDYRVVIRFFMAFLINGIGFHILIHALPLQIARQSTYMGIVAVAIGRMYLVDLDDTPGYTLYIDSDVASDIDEKKSLLEKEKNIEVVDTNKAIEEVRAILKKLEDSAAKYNNTLTGGDSTPHRLSFDINP